LRGNYALAFVTGSVLNSGLHLPTLGEHSVAEVTHPAITLSKSGLMLSRRPLMICGA